MTLLDFTLRIILVVGLGAAIGIERQLQAVAREALLLKALRSEDLADSHTVRVRAEVVTTGRSDHVIEEITSRLSMEPGIRAISWEIGGQNGKEQA
jgi:uncharacterized membrane protein YhiD involved in acid resistance